MYMKENDVLDFLRSKSNLIDVKQNQVDFFSEDFCLLYMELFCDNERTYNYIDSVYEKNITKYLKMSKTSKLSQVNFVCSISYKKSIYARKVLGIVLTDHDLDFIVQCIKLGWNKLYKFICNSNQISLVEIMSKYTKFGDVYDKSMIVTILICHIFNIDCAEYHSNSWENNVYSVFASCRCFAMSENYSLGYINKESREDVVKRDSFGFWKIESFRYLYDLFNNEPNNCMEEVRRVLPYFESRNREYLKEILNTALTVNVIPNGNNKELVKLLKNSDFPNKEYCHSLYRACVNYSLRKNVSFERCFDVFECFLDVIDKNMIDISNFYLIEFDKNDYQFIYHLVNNMSEIKPESYMTAYIHTLFAKIYNNCKAEASNYNMSLSVNQLENHLLKIEALKTKCSDIKSENEILHKKNSEFEKIIERVRNQSKQNLLLVKKNGQLAKEVEIYKVENKKLSYALEQLECLLYKDHSPQDSNENIDNDMRQIDFNGYNICVIGGYAAWRNKIKKSYDSWDVFSQDDIKRTSNLDEERYDIIIFNIMGSAHSIFYKIITKMKNYNKLLIINTSNLSLSVEMIKDRISKR